MIKRGFIGKAYLYDINSAYPYAIANLPDLEDGTWIKQKTIHKDAKIGFFKILCNIPDEKYIPPFAFRANQRIIEVNNPPKPIRVKTKVVSRVYV